MKKLILFSSLFLCTLKAAQMGIIDAAEDVWSISYEDLERAYRQSEVKIGGVPNLVDLTTRRITKTICDPAIKNLPWELKDIIAQQWYKEKFGKWYDHALKQAQAIPFIAVNSKDENLSVIAVLKNGDIATRSKSLKNATIWDPITGIKKIKLVGHAAEITKIEILPNGDIITRSWDKTAIIWDPITGKQKLELTGTHPHEVLSIAILPNRDIVTGTWDGTTIIWDPITGKQKTKLAGHADVITSIAILPNGDIVTGSHDGIAIIWDPITGKQKKKLAGHIDTITSITILQNGDIVTGSRDGIAIIWDPTTGKQKTKLAGHIGGIASIGILQNGDIATGSYDGRAVIWKISESIKNLFGSDLNNITLDIICELDRLRDFENKFKPKKSNPSCKL